MHFIMFGKTDIPFVVKRSFRRKSVGLTVRDSQSVEVVAPKNLDDARIEEIVRRKAKWILEKWAYFREIEDFPGNREFVSGEKLSYLGRQYPLKVKENGLQAPAVSFKQGFQVAIPEGQSEKARRKSVEKAVLAWYRRQAKKRILERVERFAKLSGLRPSGVKIKSQKTRWGSCSSKGNVNINWRIMLAPLRVVDYVVVHELCHLKHPNHSKKFWRELEKIMPDYQSRRDWLRRHGPRLAL